MRRSLDSRPSVPDVFSIGEPMRDPAPSPSSAPQRKPARVRLHESIPMPTFLDLGVPETLANVLAADGKTEAFATVSYTHLTLPTILLV